MIDVKLKRHSETSEKKMLKILELSEQKQQKQYEVLQKHFKDQGAELLANFTTMLTANIPQPKTMSSKIQRLLRSSTPRTPKKRTNNSSDESSIDVALSSDSDEELTLVN